MRPLCQRDPDPGIRGLASRRSRAVMPLSASEVAHIGPGQLAQPGAGQVRDLDQIRRKRQRSNVAAFRHEQPSLRRLEVFLPSAAGVAVAASPAATRYRTEAARYRPRKPPRSKRRLEDRQDAIRGVTGVGVARPGQRIVAHQARRARPRFGSSWAGLPRRYRRDSGTMR